MLKSFNKVMDYWTEYLGISDNQTKNTTNLVPEGSGIQQFPGKIFQPYTITTKTISYYSQPKRRDPSRRWK